MPTLYPKISNLFTFPLLFTLVLLLACSALTSAQKSLYILNRGNHSLVSVSPDNPGSSVTLVADQGFHSAYDLVADASSGVLYWVDGFNQKITQSNASDPLSQTASPFIVTTPVDLKLDQANQLLYWMDNAEKRIVRAKLDGSGAETVPTSELSNPSALELISALDLLFYADIGNHSIWSSSLSGANPKQLVKTDAEFPVRLLIDPVKGKLYWANDGEHLIERINFDGSDREIFYQGTEEEHPFGLFLDQENGLLYWTDYGTDQVMRAKVNSPAMPELVVDGLSDPIAVVILDKPAFQPDISSDRENQEAKTPRIALYPNPASQLVIFTSLKQDQAIEWLKVFDQTGNQLYYQSVGADTHKLDIQTFPEGYYSYTTRVAGQLISGHFSIVH
jgi:hypothetical protein